ncbi:uncharacterized protein LOC110440304 [Mizuhopecten yessoensis]|uniref:Uncharacterized protein n=1 Tax=Mizuhopecten yessoensis TaxID=6573 RepID=A0A210PLF7_MIZYE|nr:uncharacterized protein LOC110440304 [Mizuhopecten yessoensis]OWF37315.1 hypothetical protein KP79_PYT18392 [Mizuhopecten yessoensis]
MEPQYLRDVTVCYRTCSSPVLHETTFNLRTMSASSSRTRSVRSSTPSISVMPLRASSTRPSISLDIRDRMMTELRFYFGRDDRFNFRQTLTPKSTVRSVANDAYRTNNNDASRQLFRSSVGSPRRRIFTRGIRVGSART